MLTLPLGALATPTYGTFPPALDGSIPADAEPTTPRIDQVKSRAEPEPEKHELVLSPTSSFLLSNSPTESLSEDGYKSAEEVMSISHHCLHDGGEGASYIEAEGEEGVDEGSSPTDRSRSWVAEEGEVFRKGTVLLGPEEMEGRERGKGRFSDARFVRSLRPRSKGFTHTTIRILQECTKRDRQIRSPLLCLLTSLNVVLLIVLYNLVESRVTLDLSFRRR